MSLLTLFFTCFHYKFHIVYPCYCSSNKKYTSTQSHRVMWKIIIEKNGNKIKSHRFSWPILLQNEIQQSKNKKKKALRSDFLYRISTNICTDDSKYIKTIRVVSFLLTVSADRLFTKEIKSLKIGS